MPTHTHRLSHVWLAVAALSAAVAILADASMGDQRGLFLIAKPLTTLLLIGYARQRAAPPAIVLGLALSLGGDVALMFEGGFTAGLACFLAAHLAYLWAFTREHRLGAWWPPFTGYAALATVMLVQLWPGLPAALRGPVVVYVAVLATMAAQAAGINRLAALGGLLFVASDAALAWSRFHTPLPMVALWVLPAYWTAQALIAASLSRTAPLPQARKD